MDGSTRKIEIATPARGTMGQHGELALGTEQCLHHLPDTQFVGGKENFVLHVENVRGGLVLDVEATASAAHPADGNGRPVVAVEDAEWAGTTSVGANVHIPVLEFVMEARRDGWDDCSEGGQHHGEQERELESIVSEHDSSLGEGAFSTRGGLVGCGRRSYAVQGVPGMSNRATGAFPTWAIPFGVGHL